MINSLNKQIKVANIIEEGRIGGPQLRMALIASALNKKIDTTLIFPKKNSSDFQKKCNELGIKYHLMPLTTIKRSWITMITYIIFFPYEIVSLFLFLKKNNFNIVHLSGGSWQFKGIIAAKLANIKVIWELNETYVPLVIKIIFYFLSNLSNCFIYASHKTKNYYKKLVPKVVKNFIIQSPVDISFFDPNISYNLNNIEKTINLKKTIIGTVSNVNPVKGLDTLINAAKKLDYLKNEIIFLIIGAIHSNQKKYYGYLENLLKKNGLQNVYFLGKRNDIRELLSIMNIYICCSKYESSPLSVWEAMSMKKAIISTNVGDVERFIDNKSNGLIVPSGDENLLAEAIKKFIKNPELRIEYGKKSREIAEKQLNIERCAQLNLEAYELISIKTESQK